MSMDIVDRLTNRNMPYGSLALIDEAAKEIERLRAALRVISNHELRDHEDYESIQDIAIDALRGKSVETAV